MTNFVAVTENGNQTGQIWYNDHNNQTSELIPAAEVAEICAMSQEEIESYNSLSDLNADTLPFGNFSFSQERKF